MNLRWWGLVFEFRKFSKRERNGLRSRAHRPFRPQRIYYRADAVLLGPSVALPMFTCLRKFLLLPVSSHSLHLWITFSLFSIRPHFHSREEKVCCFRAVRLIHRRESPFRSYSGLIQHPNLFTHFKPNKHRKEPELRTGSPAYRLPRAISPPHRFPPEHRAGFADHSSAFCVGATTRSARFTLTPK